MYTIMRNIFINNYRKVVRDQTFVDQTENLYHLSPPAGIGIWEHGKFVWPERNAPHSKLTAKRIQSAFCNACFRIQIPRNCRKAQSPVGNRKEQDLLYTPKVTGRIERFQIIALYNLNRRAYRFLFLHEQFLVQIFSCVNLGARGRDSTLAPFLSHEKPQQINTTLFSLELYRLEPIPL